MNKEALSPVPEKFYTEKVLRSGSSQVFLVRSKDSSQRYIYRIFDGDESVYRALMKVNSKHLPKIYSTRILEGRVHVVEEYIQGDTLAFLLEAGPLPVSYVAKKICQGLQDLHAVGIIHRDIKPDNIIIQGNSVYLIDFNVSRLEKIARTVIPESWVPPAMPLPNNTDSVKQTDGQTSSPWA